MLQRVLFEQNPSLHQYCPCKIILYKWKCFYIHCMRKREAVILKPHFLLFITFGGFCPVSTPSLSLTSLKGVQDSPGGWFYWQEQGLDNLARGFLIGSERIHAWHTKTHKTHPWLVWAWGLSVNLLLLLSKIYGVVLDCLANIYVYTNRQRPLRLLRETFLQFTYCS